ncbi:MAG: sporulation integral membrane protein YtvI [Syntrophomonadaceae bacterium]
MDLDLQKYLKLLARIAIIVMLLVAAHFLYSYVFPIIGEILSYLPELFLPFIIAVILAVLIEPLVVFFETKLRFRRTLAVLTSLGLSFGGLTYLIVLIMTTIVSEVTSLYFFTRANSDEIIDRVMTSFNDIQLFYLRLDLPQQIQDSIEDSLEALLKLVNRLMDASIEQLVNWLTMLPSLFIFLIISTIATFFIMKDRALIREFFLGVIPDKARLKTRDVIGQLFKTLVGFVKAYSILVSTTAVVTMVALKLLGIKYILTIGIIVGLLDILPVLGPGLLFIPWILWQFIIGKTSLGIGLIVVYAVISVVRQSLEPKVVGHNIGLHPLATLVSLYIGLQIGGFKGMIIVPVLVVIFVACYRAGVFNQLIWRKM